MKKLVAVLIALLLLPCATFAAKPVKVDLEAMIEAEAETRALEDTNLQNNIKTEAAIRHADDDALQNQIDNLNSTKFGNILVYDANDDFIGYMVSSDTYGNTFSLISLQKYFAIINSEYWAFLEGQSHPDGLTNMCYGRVWYDNPTCTGTYYVGLHPENLFHRVRPGIVCGGTTAPITVQPHYIPLEATTLILNSAYVMSSNECVGYFDGIEVYQPLPNDPAVTGFPNTFSGPFNPVIIQPPMP